jgi:hypothetical protein
VIGSSIAHLAARSAHLLDRAGIKRIAARPQTRGAGDAGPTLKVGLVSAARQGKEEKRRQENKRRSQL